MLVVEDDAALLELVSRVLTGAGYTVLTASSAEQAGAPLLAHQGELDLLLTDVVLPGESGIALAERARVLYPDEELGVVTVAALGYCLIRKPFSAARLLTAVRDSLSQRPSA